IESRYIGRIEIHEDYSTVDLPDGMPKEIFQHLKKVRVRQHPLNISRFDGLDAGAPRKPPRRTVAEKRTAAGAAEGLPARKARKRNS
ncbi:MAG TPA: ATP-dependent RNA helicase, partial [Candidatus Competibacteraceae bacterium]|nr:ATP-dependent RNA helicase [Candidatus Competibacteraceae bacterium]